MIRDDADNYIMPLDDHMLMAKFAELATSVLTAMEKRGYKPSDTGALMVEIVMDARRKAMIHRSTRVSHVKEVAHVLEDEDVSASVSCDHSDPVASTLRY